MKRAARRNARAIPVNLVLAMQLADTYFEQWSGD
jgi:hypothetical protein